MLYHLAIGIGLMVVLMLLWLGVQHLVRKNSPELPPDCDVLEGKIGCHGCALEDKCQLSR